MNIERARSSQCELMLEQLKFEKIVNHQDFFLQQVGLMPKYITKYGELQEDCEKLKKENEKLKSSLAFEARLKKISINESFRKLNKSAKLTLESYHVRKL